MKRLFAGGLFAGGLFANGNWAGTGLTVTYPTVGQAIANFWEAQGLGVSVGTFYHVEIERMENLKASIEALTCVMMDMVPATQVNVGKNKRGHDRIRRQFVVVGTDPLEIQAACRRIFDTFNRLEEGDLPLSASAGRMVGCRPISPREVAVVKNRLPAPSGKSLLNGTVEVQFTLTRGEAS